MKFKILNSQELTLVIFLGSDPKDKVPSWKWLCCCPVRHAADFLYMHLLVYKKSLVLFVYEKKSTLCIRTCTKKSCGEQGFKNRGQHLFLRHLFIFPYKEIFSLGLFSVPRISCLIVHLRQKNLRGWFSLFLFLLQSEVSHSSLLRGIFYFNWSTEKNKQTAIELSCLEHSRVKTPNGGLV